MPLPYEIPTTGFITPGVASAEKLVSNIIGILTAVAFLFFVFQTIFAAFQYLSSEGDKNKIETSRKRLTEGVLGLVIVVVALGLGSLLASLLGVKDVFNFELLFGSIGI